MSNTFISNPFLELNNNGELVLCDQNNAIHWMSNKELKEIDWNVQSRHNWALSCDFIGNDLANIHMKQDLCPSICKKTKDCSHNYWNNFEGGTCWLKKGIITEQDAIYTNNILEFCGYFY